jgi:hypothetical protein
MKLELEQDLQRLIVVEELVLYANMPYLMPMHKRMVLVEEKRGEEGRTKRKEDAMREEGEEK